ncbi:amino acid adenylation domain-containing protein [Streptomyces sp. NPDC054786]
MQGINAGRSIVVPDETVIELPDIGLVGLFAKRVADDPEAIAICGEEGPLTYAELDARANQLAWFLLRRCGPLDGRVVALVMQRSVRLVVAILATLKAGAAYLPLDPGNPVARNREMVRSADARVVLADDPDLRAKVLADTGILGFDANPDCADEPVHAPDITVSPDWLAYVMCTSGSTGMPKGVAVSHRNVVALVLDHRWDTGNHDRVLFHSSHAFDASTYELWVPLARGGQVVIAPPSQPDAAMVRTAIAEHGVTALWLTAGLFRLIAHEAPESFAGAREVWTGGDVVPAAAVRRVLTACPGLAVVDGYGPTETTTFATCYQMRDAGAVPDVIPIGRPMDNTRVYLLDDDMTEVPAGEPGEVCIAGAGVALGYLGRPDHVGERFLDDPFVPGERMYRTGDIARWSAERQLEFLGRADEQVKLRGFRIEPAEIEVVLAEHPAVAQAVVVVREDQPGEKRLIGYVVATARQADNEELAISIREFTLDRLPDYMIPTAVVLLPELPLLHNGKVDRKVLPAPGARSMLTSVYEPPRTTEEALLCGVFADVLDVDLVGIDDDFFALGGHSLSATMAISRIEAAFGATVAGYRDLFEQRTARRLGAAITEALRSGTATDVSAIVPVPRDRALPLSLGQQAVWEIEQQDPGNPAMNAQLAVRVRGRFDLVTWRAAVRAVVQRHESLRTVYRQDGAVVVHEILPTWQGEVSVSKVDSMETARQLASDDAGQPFDLGAGPLLRATVLRLGANDHVVLVTTHRMATDVWSLGVLGDELSTAYASIAEGREPDWPRLPVQYGDYAVWQRERLTGLDVQWRYWQDKVRGFVGDLRLPYDREPEVPPSNESGALVWRLPGELMQGVRALAVEEGATLYQTLLTAFFAVFSKYSERKDVAIATPIAGRTRTEIENLIGPFANLQLLRTDVSGELVFRELLGRVKETTLGAQTHQDLPFGRLVPFLFEQLEPGQDLFTNWPLRVAIQLINTPPRGSETGHGEIKMFQGGVIDIANADVEVFHGSRRFTHWDVEVHMIEDGAEVRAHVGYRTRVFEAETVRRLTDEVTEVLRTEVEDSGRSSR